MSSKTDEKKDHPLEPEVRHYEEPFPLALARLVKPFSELMCITSRPDIYTGEESIPFQERHPIYKALMKLEFQDLL